MQQFIFLGFFLFGIGAWCQAQSPQYLVEFDTGQTAITLAQLDSIKNLVRQSQQTGLSKIRVVAYAHDAKKGDTNEQLSRRRAYLIQQCLEREGVPLSLLDIQNVVCDATVEVCTACANLSLEESDGSLPRNSYIQRNLEFLYGQAKAKTEQFWINPSEDNYLVSQEGIFIYLPAQALMTTYNSPVEVTLRVLQTSQEHWQHGLATTSSTQQLQQQQSILLQARQEGVLLPHVLRYPATIVLPNQQAKPQHWQLWQQQERQWQQPSTHSSNSLFLGDYYKDKKTACPNTNNQAVYAPNYGPPPLRPNYLNVQQSTQLQDAAIASLEERLKPLEEGRYNKSGKKEIWTPQQKQRAFQLSNQKAQLLVTREKIRREAQQKNTQLEENYYQALGQYNRRRHQLQTQYIQALEQRARHARFKEVDPKEIMEADRCLALQQYQQLLQAAYDSSTYNQLAQRLAQVPAQGQRDLGYWLRSEQLGWLSLAQAAPTPSTNTTSFFAQSNHSPYKTTAFYHQKDGQIFRGQAQEDGRLAFVGIDPAQAGHVLAVVEKEGDFWLALQAVGGKGMTLVNKTVGLQFDYQSLEEALQQHPTAKL